MQKQLIFKILSALLIVMLALAALPVTPAYAAARTASVTGAWNSTATWGGLSVPVLADTCTINSGVTVTITTAATCTSLVVNGTLILSTGGSITIATITVSSTGTYQHAQNGGVIPTATWNAASTVLVTGMVATVPTGFGQTFGNFTWNSTGQTANAALAAGFTVAGDLSIQSTGAGVQQIRPVDGAATTVGGNYLQTGGDIRIARNAASSLTVSGNFTVSGGNFDLSTGNGVGTLNVGGNFSHTAGTITESGGGGGSGAVVFGTGTHTYTSGGTISNTVNFTVNSPGTLQMAADTTTVNGGGTFTLASGATLGVTSPAGITAAPGTATGNIRTTTGRTFTAGANYIYNGTAAQVTGTGLTQNMPANLTINNTAGVTLSAATTISSTLTIGSGATLSTSASNFNMTVGGNWTNNGGTFTPGTNSVTFNGNSAAINGSAASQTFNNVTLTKTAGQTLSVGGSTTTLTVNNLTEITGNFTAPATLNVNGNLTLTAGTFTAGATTNVTGTFTHNFGNTFTAGTNTVVLNGTGAQTIGGTAATAFYDLTISGASGVKTLPANTTITHTLSIAPSGISTASLNAGTIYTVPNLTLGGAGTTSGSWGSNSSAATNQTNTYFTPTAGYVNVTNDTSKLDQTINVVTAAPSSATYGSTFPVAATASSGLGVAITTTGGCSVLAGTVTMTSSTVACVVHYNQAGDTTYKAAPEVTSSTTAQKATPTVAFSAAPTPNYLGGNFTVSASTTNTDSSILTYTYVSGPCAFVSGANFSSSGAGICVVQANGAATTNFNAASQTQNVTIGKANQTITFVAPVSPAAYNSTFAVAPTSDSLLTVTVTPSGGCSILTGTVTMTSGTTDCTLTASQAGDGNYNAATDVVRTVTAQKINQTITFAAPVSPAAYNSTFAVAPTSNSLLTVTVTPSGGCSILAGTVTMTSGTTDCTLTASQTGDGNYNAATDVVRTVTAQKINQTITFAAPVSPANYNSTFAVAPTSNSLLAVTVTPTGGCSILAGTVTMTSGTTDCTLTASQAGDNNYNAATDVVRTVTAQKINQTITFAAPVSPAAYNSTFAVAPTSDSSLTVTVTPTGVCTILAGTVTMTSGTGLCTLTASQAGDNNYNAATDVVRTVTAQKANQTITFAAPASPATYNSTFAVAPTSDSLLTVTVTPTGVCTILAGTVTMTSGTGLCTLTASQAGDGNYNAATDVVRTVTAQKANQTITFAAPASPAAYNSTFAVAPTSDSSLTVTVTPTGVCTILAGTVTMTNGAGTCTLTASQAGDGNYNAATDVVRTVTAQKANQTITFAAPVSPAAYNSTFAVAPTSDSSLTVTVTPSGGCSILAGTVTMTSGTTDCTLTASQAGDGNYNAATDVVRTVAAQKINQTITFAAPVSPAAYNSTFAVAPTSNSGLTVTVTPTGGCSILVGTVTMTSGTTNCTLTASQAGDNNYNAATDVVRTVTAQKINQTITFAAPVSPAAYNSTFAVAPTSDSLLTVTVTPTGGCSILAGTVTMTSGTTNCTLTASQAGDNNYNAATDVVRTVAAQKIGQTITFAAPVSPAAYNSTFAVAPTSNSSLTVTVTPSGGCTILAGTVTMTSGTTDCTLTASQAGDNNYNAATDVVRTVAAQKINQTITFAAPVSPAAYNSTFVVAPTSDSLLTVTVTPTGVCTILASTVTMTNGTGTCTLTASQAGNTNYNAATDVVRTVAAQKINQTITFAPPASPVAYNGTFVVAPTSNSGLTVTVTPTGVCTILAGTVTMTNGIGTCTLTASQAGDNNYNAATDVVRTVVAQKANQTITFAAPASPAAYNSTFSVAPTSNSSLTVTVTPSGGCSILAGTVTMTSGTTDCTLTASQAGDGNYNAATDVVRIVAAQKINQTITFAAPVSPAAYNSTFAVAPTSDSGLTVTVTPTGVCTILTGTVTMTNGTGICTLTASQAGNTNYNAATDVVRTVTAQKIGQTITFAAPASPAAYNSTFAVAPTSDSLLTVTVTPSGGCSILAGTVTMTSGTTNCTLTASQAGDSNYNAATDVVRTVAAQKIGQTITFAAPASPAAYNSTFAVAPTSDSLLTVTVTPSGGCSILAGTVTMTSGTTDCTLTASQVGDNNYNAATDVVRTVAAQKINQTITFAAPVSPANYNSTFAVAPTSNSGLTVTVTPTGVCTILAGTVTMTSGTGVCTLTASQAGDSNYNAATNVVRTVTAQKINQTITFTAPVNAAYNSTFPAAPTSDSGLTVTVTPSGVCTILAGTVTMTSGAGICTLTASQAGNGNYNAATDVVRTVTAFNNLPSGTNKTITMNENTTYTFAAADFGFTDPNLGDVMSAVRIDSLPTAGSLTLSGVPVIAGQVIPDANIGTLAFKPAFISTGSPYATFTFSVQDTGGPAYDPTPNTITINVVAVFITPYNDAPFFTKGADQTVYKDAGAQNIVGWATGINDGDTELTQILTFNVTDNTNPGLFTVAPAIDAVTGNLTYTPAATSRGSATITITLSDDGSNIAPNVNTSIEQTFVINTLSFSDVPINHWAWQYIEALYNAGITSGCSTSPLRYCPAASVTRAEMAVFLLRGIHGKDYTPPAATGLVFTDVPTTYWGASWIEQLAVEGITVGCGDGNYCPDAPVTRAEMALFLLRTKHGSSYIPPAATGAVFTDVPVNHWAAGWIEQLALEGITVGCGGGNFCPDSVVTRDQMAVFLVRVFNLPLALP